MNEQPHSPTIDHLENEAATVTAELERLLETARDLLRRVQDVEAEIEAGGNGSAQASRHALLYDLRTIGRQLLRAQATLVPKTDERSAAAHQVLGWLDEAERDDRPWKSAAA